MKKPIIPIIILTTLFATALIANATLPPLSPPPVGGYDSGSNSILDPGCAPGTPNCWVNLPSGGSGWSLTGNTGTTVGTNFIGTTDAQDFMVKTNGNQIALFGQQGNVAIGSDNTGIDPILTLPVASNIGSIAFQSGQSTGIYATAFGLGQASNDAATAFARANATGSGSMAWGMDTIGGFINPVASGETSTAWGNRGTIASGHTSTAFGSAVLARSRDEVAFGFANTDYTPASTIDPVSEDRLFSIGNGFSGRNNAYTLWKDGSFAYNDDNFQNDNPGTEQNMFYFNYGNHDGAGSAQTKRAIRLGSAVNDEWDINSANVGDRSFSFGFGGGIASGNNSFVFGEAVASGSNSVAFNQGAASGDTSFAWGKSADALGDTSFAFSTGDHATASGSESWAMGHGVDATGDYSKTFGFGTRARSYGEITLGIYNTDYIPLDPNNINGGDRLFVFGNGSSDTPGFLSDAFTILKNGQTGIAIDNFETNTNGNIFQVGDGSIGIIGYVDNGTGNWMAVSDERKKHNITDIQYGLNEILQLKPVSFDYNRNNEHTIGFLAQQVLPIIPEAVGGDAEKGYSMSYATITPALVKAIQELNLKIDLLSLNTGNTSINVFDSLKSWFADVGNGIETIIAKVFKADRVETKELCVGQTCLNEQQIQHIIQSVGVSATSPSVTQTDGDVNDTNLPSDSGNNSTNNDATIPGSEGTSSDQPITRDATSNPDPEVNPTDNSTE